MKRTMFQLYLNGCDEAIELYAKAFNATIDTIHRNPDNGMIAHAEIIAFGQYITFMESGTDTISGNTMQFCFHFEKGDEESIKKAYDALKESAVISQPLGSCEWSHCIFSLVDKFGVNWLLFCT